MKRKIFFADYITERLDGDALRKQVCRNLKDGKVKGSLAKPYFEYCQKNGMDDALELADTIIKDGEYAEWIRRSALDYAVETKNYNYVMERYLENADDKMLNLIVDKCKEYKDERLVKRMINENKESADGLKFLKELIEAESEFGLNQYYKLAKEKNAVQDLNQDVCEITEAIGEISGKKHIDILIKLVLLKFGDGFQDKCSSELYNSTYKAIKNIAQNNPKEVMRYLEKAKKENRNNLELGRCYSVLLTYIEAEYLSNEDKAWTIREVKEYMTNIKEIDKLAYNKNRTDKILKDLMSACIRLQANSHYYKTPENKRNDFIRDFNEDIGI